MSPILDTDNFTSTLSQDSDCWAKGEGVSSYTLRHLGLLHEKIEHILWTIQGKDTVELSYQLQRVIFKSHLDTDIRRKISKQVTWILGQFSKISENHREEIRDKILKVTVNIQELLQNRTPIATFWNSDITRPVHQKIRSTIFWESEWFEATEEQLSEIDIHKDYWFLILLEILESKSLRLRDIYAYRLCEVMIAAGFITHELAPDILHIRVLKALLDESMIAKYARLNREEREKHWNENMSSTPKNISNQIGPRLSEKIKIVKLHDRWDVNGDFAWSVDSLVKKFEKMKKEILKID